jgi:hypothetical protein
MTREHVGAFSAGTITVRAIGNGRELWVRALLSAHALRAALHLFSRKPKTQERAFLAYVDTGGEIGRSARFVRSADVYFYSQILDSLTARWAIDYGVWCAVCMLYHPVGSQPHYHPVGLGKTANAVTRLDSTRRTTPALRWPVGSGVAAEPFALDAFATDSVGAPRLGDKT